MNKLLMILAVVTMAAGAEAATDRGNVMINVIGDYSSGHGNGEATKAEIVISGAAADTLKNVLYNVWGLGQAIVCKPVDPEGNVCTITIDGNGAALPAE